MLPGFLLTRALTTKKACAISLLAGADDAELLR